MDGQNIVLLLVNIKEGKMVKNIPCEICGKETYKQLKRLKNLKVVNFFVVNLVRRFGEIKNLSVQNITIGKRGCLPIEVFYQEIKYLNFVFYVKPRMKECLLCII